MGWKAIFSLVCPQCPVWSENTFGPLSLGRVTRLLWAMGDPLSLRAHFSFSRKRAEMTGQKQPSDVGLPSSLLDAVGVPKVLIASLSSLPAKATLAVDGTIHDLKILGSFDTRLTCFFGSRSIPNICLTMGSCIPVLAKLPVPYYSI